MKVLKSESLWRVFHLLNYLVRDPTSYYFRWLDPNCDQVFQKGGYISFGLGPRQCVGMRLAYMEEKMLLAHILRKYTFEVGTKTEIPLKLVGRATTQPETVWMHLKQRI